MEVTIGVKTIKNYKLKPAQLDQSFLLLAFEEGKEEIGGRIIPTSLRPKLSYRVEDYE
jgi:hypothetical protein